MSGQSTSSSDRAVSGLVPRCRCGMPLWVRRAIDRGDLSGLPPDPGRPLTGRVRARFASARDAYAYAQYSQGSYLVHDVRGPGGELVEVGDHEAAAHLNAGRIPAEIVDRAAT